MWCEELATDSTMKYALMFLLVSLMTIGVMAKIPFTLRNERGKKIIHNYLSGENLKILSSSFSLPDHDHLLIPCELKGEYSKICNGRLLSQNQHFMRKISSAKKLFYDLFIAITTKNKVVIW